jgi:hypothetical protein
MSSFNSSQDKLDIHPFLALIFTVTLRELLDESTTGDKSDAAWTYGL